MDVPIIQGLTEVIPQGACQFYYGYYESSLNMGSLILKLGFLFAILDLIHYVIKYTFENIIIPIFRKKRLEKIQNEL